MRRSRRLLAVVVAVVAPLVALCSSAVASRTPHHGSRPPATATANYAEPLGAPGPWSLEFNQTFNGGSLDLSKWSYGVYPRYFGPVNIDETENYSSSQVSVEGGDLRLSVVADTNTYIGPRDSLSAAPGTTEPYLSGAINTEGKESFTYGFFEAKIYVPGNAHGQIYNWPAWWMTNEDWPTNGEIDVFEGLAGRAGWHFHWGTTVLPLAVGKEPSGQYTGWHVFGADWEPGRITYYYDGRAVGLTRRNVTGSPLYLILDLATGGDGGRTVAPSMMLVDFVRVWQR